MARPFPETNSHHKLNNKLPAPISTTSETCHPDRSNPTFSSHLTSCEMVGLRSGGTSLFFSFHEGLPQARFGSLGLRVACSVWDPAPTAAAKWASAPASTPGKNSAPTTSSPSTSPATNASSPNPDLGFNSLILYQTAARISLTRLNAML